ncbi:MAG: hypothetical protein ABJF04_03870 [Reichenbachiella sp.]|uniref:hypothetical protein n=1 Tax=Reichenbachiella sp. TaxID=2184521 RepID=UPI003267905F
MNIKNEHINLLENLFQFTPPTQLRQSLTYVFFNYLSNAKTGLPNNFDRISEDFYFLIDFLEEVEKECGSLDSEA